MSRKIDVVVQVLVVGWENAESSHEIQSVATKHTDAARIAGLNVRRTLIALMGAGFPISHVFALMGNAMNARKWALRHAEMNAWT